MKIILLFYAVISVVFCDYDESYYGSPLPWSHAVGEYDHVDDWWYDNGGHNSHATEYLSETSPFYLWFKEAQLQYDMFAPAKHAGKINRGKFSNPELNLPADRAFGHESDFRIDDFVSGAFEYRPRGQKFLARKVDVDAGIANSVGEVIRLPLPVYVKGDGTLLVQAFGDTRANPRDACTRNPNPCSNFPARPRCVPINGNVNTVKCMGPVNTKLVLRWIDPEDETDQTDNDQANWIPNIPNDLFLFLVPAKYDGTPCPDASLLGPSSSTVCGATMGTIAQALSKTIYVKETALLTTQSDGSSPMDYSYAVYVTSSSTFIYNLNEGRPQLIVYDDTYGSMSAVQVITIPQGDSINTNNKNAFFFGCLHPSTNKVNMTSSGFYTIGLGFIRNTGLAPFETGVCNKLRLS